MIRFDNGKTRRTFAILLALTAGSCHAADFTLESGNYEGLHLAINAAGEVAGIFEETAGLDQRPTCQFRIRGKVVNDHVDGVIWAVSQPAKKIAIKSVASGLEIDLMDSSSFICPPEMEALGPRWTLERVEAESWNELREIKSEKSYFYDAPDVNRKRKAYLVNNDWVGVIDRQDDWIRVEYIGGKKRSKGWLKIEDTSSIAPK